MIIVGKQKKAPKDWCVVRNSVTGKFYCGYEPDIFVGNAEEINRKAAVAKKELETYKTTPEKPEYPGIMWTRGCPVYAEYYRKQAVWDIFKRQLRESQLEGFEYGPVFRASLKFDSYSRGRSSVTMNFHDECGFPIFIGPNGISQFITAISEGKIVLDGFGRFVMQFILSKKGQNVYAVPFYEPYDSLGEGKEELK